MTNIHSTAIIDPNAQLADDVIIGPLCLVGPGVEIDSGTQLHSHIVVKGPTKIGKNNIIYQFSSVGEDCQDKKYQGEKTYLEIGDNNIIRESCTIHRGTVQDDGITKIGNNNLLMAYAHVAHDCRVGNSIVMANNTNLAGHVEVADYAILGGFTGIHQFCKVGSHSMCAGGSIVFKDIPAYVMVGGNPASAHGLNLEGMKRHSYSKEVMHAIRQAYKIVYRSGLTLQDALKDIEPLADEYAEVELFMRSLETSTRGIVR